MAKTGSLVRLLRAKHFEIDIRRGQVWRRFGLQFKTLMTAYHAAHGTGWDIRIVRIQGAKRIVISGDGIMQITRLRNGDSVPSVILHGVVRLLQFAAVESPEALIAAVELARDPEYLIAEPQRAALHEYGLLEADGSMRNEVRSVIESAAEGDGEDLVIASPVARAR